MSANEIKFRAFSDKLDLMLHFFFGYNIGELIGGESRQNVCSEQNEISESTNEWIWRRGSRFGGVFKIYKKHNKKKSVYYFNIIELLGF